MVIGCFQEENKQNYEAIDYFKECISKEETYADAYHKLADIFLSLKDLDKAIHYASEGSKYKQSDVELNNLIGLCYFMKVSIVEFGSTTRATSKRPTNTCKQRSS
jgi:tetratricopeptide (TPR) repeat protein